MAGKFAPPKELNFTGNLSENWRKWKREFQFYLTATESDEKSNEVKTSRLLTAIGERARDVYYTFTFDSEGDEMKLDKVLEKFDSYMSPKKNITYMRYRFFSYNQGDEQSTDEYVTELRSRAEHCSFGDLKSSLIRDKIVIGVHDKKVQERLLREPDLSLEQAIQICRAAEEVKLQSKEIKGETKTSESLVDAVNKNAQRNTNEKRPRTMIKNCKYCGKEHFQGRCPAYNRQCGKCGKYNHFASVCMSKPRQNVRQINRNEQNNEDDDFEYLLSSLSTNNSHHSAQKQDDLVSKPDSENTSEEFFISNINGKSDENRWEVSLNTCGTDVSYMLDTGAQVNVLPEKVYRTLTKRPRLSPTKAKLTAYDGGNIPVQGKCITHINQGSNKTVPVQFFVVKTEAFPIIGLKTCEQLNLIKRVYKLDVGYDSMLENYDVFGDLGCLPEEYHIHVDPTIKPVVHPARRVPFALRDKLKSELDRMTLLGVIEKVEKPTDWVNSIVVVEKPNGDIRICLDPKDLNRAIKREFSQMPTTEEITSQMSGAKLFSKLDASAGYWQMKLDEPSSDLLAFNTPFGRYKFKRLPFGVHCASEIFSKRISELLNGLEGVAHIQDDIIIWGNGKEQHDNRLRLVLDRIKSCGLKLNRAKCVFGVKEIKYVGHIFSHQGLQVDPSKIEAIVNMPIPQNTSAVHRFLGMITYLGRFIPNLSSKTSELRKLLQKDKVWEWSEKHAHQFRNLQKCITTSPVLQYFNPSLPIKLSVDASKEGLGAVLLQLHNEQWRPIAYASRALNSSEQNYSQIEKETLAVVFGTEHFNQYVYGIKFLVESDHKPLQSIFQRNIDKAPPRIQRMLLRLQKYDIELKFTPGTDIPIADALSRANLPTTSKSTLDYQVHLLMSNLPVSENKLQEIRTATAKDQVLKKVKEFILNGWPDSKKEIPGEVMPYFQFKSELTIIPEPTARSAVRRGLLIPLGYLHPGKCEHSEVQSHPPCHGRTTFFVVMRMRESSQISKIWRTT